LVSPEDEVATGFSLPEAVVIRVKYLQNTLIAWGRRKQKLGYEYELENEPKEKEMW